jgi:diadenosine tetraphosphatase ApaH/serine/threonine PP2A family protein phosphatase
MLFMGLDMFAYKVPKKDVRGKFNFKRSKEVVQIDYWRKRHDLHRWFEKLYRTKGGKDLFNYIPLKLNYRDLNQLEKDIRNKNLPKPIFEKRDIDDKLDLEFIEKARQAINDGYAVYYNSWW